MYFINLRKDLYIKQQYKQIQLAQQIDIKQEVNFRQSSDIFASYTQALNNKIDRVELTNTVNAIIQDNIQANVIASVEPFISNLIQPTLNTAISELNNIKQDIINSVNTSAYNASLTINTNMNKIYTDINLLKNDVYNMTNSLDRNSLEMNKLKLDLIEVRSLLRNEMIELNDELLEKINYLFEFFYHNDSKTIMDNYPM